MVQTILGKPAAIQRSAGTTSISQLDEKRRFYGSRVETLDVANVRLVECVVPRDYDIGRSNTDNVNQLLYSLALYPFTQFLGMSFSDFQLLIAQARSEASNPAFKAYFPV
ncbi:hypothetical protein FoTM2_006746 [Fusarium oxysporum f. sp. vasinfectum]|nr:hypothetical protein NW763_002219 [Fusarium oxysporum]KAJ4279971.1 hypothetical protein NW764_005835 [Fusarium oxysporum]KAK2932288.1 hypothetical protein FoTM2_006746 [Fusarium oxysporum f. sp. vasinfectum]WKT45759.1 hypothetical protein QSH57_010633 [Fusarium oxysporum f. sp. vasinfectum]